MAQAWLWTGTIGTVLYSLAIGIYGAIYWDVLWFFWPVGVAWLCTGVGLAALSTLCLVMAWRWLKDGRATMASATMAAPVAVGALVVLRMYLL
jgi:hypothetical protein